MLYEATQLAMGVFVMCGALLVPPVIFLAYAVIVGREL